MQIKEILFLVLNTPENCIIALEKRTRIFLEIANLFIYMHIYNEHFANLESTYEGFISLKNKRYSWNAKFLQVISFF